MNAAELISLIESDGHFQAAQNFILRIAVKSGSEAIEISHDWGGKVYRRISFYEIVWTGKNLRQLATKLGDCEFTRKLVVASVMTR